MVLVFQYGSNMSTGRLNGDDRLRRDAKVAGVAQTVELFEFGFTVWSKSNKCAAANILRSVTGRRIFGVLYEVPEYLLSKESARATGRKSMDEIEGAGTNYVRQNVVVERQDRSIASALTYVVKTPKPGLETSREYVQHILDGIMEHALPDEYRQYIVSQAVSSNGELAGVFEG